MNTNSQRDQMETYVCPSAHTLFSLSEGIICASNTGENVDDTELWDGEDYWF